MKCLNHISQSSESIHLSKIRALDGLIPFHNYWCMPWGRTGGQNIEHPHTLAILSFFFLFFFLWLQMHFSLIGKAQFRQATLFCAVFINLMLNQEMHVVVRVFLYVYYSFKESVKPVCKIIGIFNGWEVRIENSVTRRTVRHQEACRVMHNSYLEWQNFQFAPNNHDYCYT